MTPMAVYFGLIFARVGTFIAVMPLFSQRTPRVVRAGMALVLTLFYFGAVGPGWDGKFADGAAEIHPLTYAIALIRESLIGASIGLAFGLFLMPPRIAGDFISQQIGLSASSQSGVTSDTPAASLSLIFEVVASLVFLELNGHHLIFATLHGSFDRLPLGGGFVPHPIGPMMNGIQTASEMGLLLAGPLGLCLFLLSVSLAIMARAAPQLNIYSIGFTLQVLVAMLGSLYLMPDIIKLIVLIFEHLKAILPAWLE
jgi:flagellar biosynthetic protein FliR